MLRHRYSWLLVLWLMSLFGVSSAHTFRADGAMVLINEYPVFTLRATLDGWPPPKRASAICETLRIKGVKLPLTLTTKGQDLWIYSDQTRIVRVSPQEAKLYGVEQTQLVNEWKAAVETALSLPALYFEPETLLIPVEESVVARIVGTEASEATPMVEDNAIAICKRTAKGIEIEGIEVGETTATVTSPNAKITFKIKVTGRTSVQPKTIMATVSGSPATADAVNQAVRHAIASAYAGEKDFKVEVLRVDGLSLNEGTSRSILAVIRITSADTAPYVGNLNVSVRNVGIKLQQEVALWYCNDPERVVAEGIVYNQSLELGSATRMLYHHVNGMPTPMAMQVVLYNLSSIPAKVHTIVGDGEPNSDPVRTGLEAGQEFLKPWLQGQAQVIEVPGRSALPIAVRVLNPGETMSGLAHLNLMEGGPQRLLVRCEALKPSALRDYSVSAAAIPMGWPGPVRSFTMNPPEAPLSNHVYGRPFQDHSVSFKVGGRQAFVRLGESTMTSNDETVSFRGCYGVIIRIRAEVENPTDKAAIIEGVFEASAGYSGVVFAVDGKLQPGVIVQSKAEQRIVQLKLAPGERKTLNLVTAPLSGSSYPGTLTFRTVQGASSGGRTFDTDPGDK